jgi:hypothetical protein
LAGPSRPGRRPPAARLAQFVVTTDGGCPFQLTINDDTRDPEVKSTRSHPGADHRWTANPASGTAVTSRAELPVSSSVT